jgi:hypothetical protein
MMGKRGEDGLYAMAAKDIFNMLEDRSRTVQVSVALFEIYGTRVCGRTPHARAVN